MKNKNYVYLLKVLFLYHYMIILIKQNKSMPLSKLPPFWKKVYKDAREVDHIL